MPASLSSSAAIRSGVVAAILAASLGLGGCSEYEVDRPGTWQATGANEHNLRAMLVDPKDYSIGTGAITSRGDSASRAVTRLGNDRRRQLIDATVSRLGPSGAQGDSGSGGPAPGGGTAGGGGGGTQ